MAADPTAGSQILSLSSSDGRRSFHSESSAVRARFVDQRVEGVLGDLFGEAAGRVGGTRVSLGGGLGDVDVAWEEDERDAACIGAQQRGVRLDTFAQELVVPDRDVQCVRDFAVGVDAVVEDLVDRSGLGRHVDARQLLAEFGATLLGPLLQARQRDLGLFTALAGEAEHGPLMGLNDDSGVIEQGLVDVADLLDSEAAEADALAVGDL